MKHVRISAQLAEKIHEQLVSATGGASGLRDAALLESALASAWQTCGAAEPNHSAEDQAAQVCFSIIENHPFMDGNKRAGIHLLLLLLSLEKIEMHYTQDELVDLGYGLADGSLDFGYLRIWITTHKK